MIERLEQLSMEAFINLVAGDFSVLKSRHEIVSDTKLALAARDIVMEYRAITDEPGMRMFFGYMNGMLNANMRKSLFLMCKALFEAGQYDTVREIMKDSGVRTSGMDKRRLGIEIDAHIARADYDLSKQHEPERAEHEASEVRRGFDRQTAVMMTHYKFHIDTTVIKATIYAHLVARFHQEIKAQAAALKKR